MKVEKKKFCCKIHISGDIRLIGVCDRDILGMKFREGEANIHVDPGFYFEQYVDREEMARLFHTADILNLVGNDAVKLGIEEGCIDPDFVLDIEEVRHAQMVRI